MTRHATRDTFPEQRHWPGLVPAAAGPNSDDLKKLTSYVTLPLGIKVTAPEGGMKDSLWFVASYRAPPRLSRRMSPLAPVSSAIALERGGPVCALATAVEEDCLIACGLLCASFVRGGFGICPKPLRPTQIL